MKKIFIKKGKDRNTVFIIPTIELSKDYKFIVLSFMIYYIGISWDR